jgi:uncharacterized lipoprotein YmbA
MIFRRIATMAAIFVALISGCGPPQPINLPPPSPAQLGDLNSGKELTVVRPRDLRSYAGTAEVIYYSSEAQYDFADQVRLIPAPESWIDEALISALKQSGCQAKSADSLALAKTPLALTVAIKDISVFANEARILVRVELYENGRLMQARTYSGTSGYSGTCTRYGAQPSECGEAFANALTDMLREAMPDLAAAISFATGGRSLSAQRD